MMSVEIGSRLITLPVACGALGDVRKVVCWSLMRGTTVANVVSAFGLCMFSNCKR